MAKRPTAKKRSVKKVTKRKLPTQKADLQVKIGPDKKLLGRLAELGLSTMVVDEPCLQIALELDRKHKSGEMALLFQAAVQAMKAAALQSENPDDWVRAARKAAQLD
jgi:hypothetical protein